VLLEKVNEVERGDRSITGIDYKFLSAVENLNLGFGFHKKNCVRLRFSSQSDAAVLAKPKGLKSISAKGHFTREKKSFQVWRTFTLSSV